MRYALLAAAAVAGLAGCTAPAGNAANEAAPANATATAAANDLPAALRQRLPQALLESWTVSARHTQGEQAGGWFVTIAGVDGFDSYADPGESGSIQGRIELLGSGTFEASMVADRHGHHLYLGCAGGDARMPLSFRFVWGYDAQTQQPQVREVEGAWDATTGRWYAMGPMSDGSLPNRIEPSVQVRRKQANGNWTITDCVFGWIQVRG